jgi:hypothetical protein
MGRIQCANSAINYVLVLFQSLILNKKRSLNIY